MAFPESAPEVAELARVMRELGILQACGVVLGPPPPRAEAIAAAVARGDAEPQELAEEKRRARIEDARGEKRLELAATGRTYSDEEIDRFIDPMVFEP